MFTKTVIISLIGIICLSIGGYDSVFIKWGTIYDPKIEGQLTLDKCGLNYVPFEHNITHNKACFVKQYPNQTRRVVYQFPPFDTMATNPSGRIIDAREALPEDSPWTVKLFIVWGVQWPLPGQEIAECTGVFITLQWVLTAALCLPPDRNTIRKIDVMARYNGQYMMSLYPKYKVWIHERYKHTEPNSIDSQRHNIALIKMTPGALNPDFETLVEAGAFYLTNNICLPEPMDPQVLNEKEEKAILSGWGHIKTGLPTKVQLKEVTLRPAKECVDSETLCSSPGKGVSCTQDMGAPLIQYTTGGDTRRAVLVGILTNDTPTSYCNGQQIDVYAPITSYTNIEWIKRTILQNRDT